MVVIEIQLLGGRYVAIADNRKATVDARAEWPPHPVRLFSAMVSAFHDRPAVWRTDARTVLEALQAADAPEIEATNLDDDPRIGRRSVCAVFVPGNDVAIVQAYEAAAEAWEKQTAAEAGRANVRESGDRPNSSVPRDRRLVKASQEVEKRRKLVQQKLRALREQFAAWTPDRTRWRSERTFPCFIPDRDIVRFCWPRVDLEPAKLNALSALLDRVTYLGHSTSLVRCGLTDAAQSNLVPCEPDGAEYVLRVPGRNQLERLEQLFPIHRGVKPRVLPDRPQSYRVVKPEDPRRPIQPGDFNDRDWIVFAAPPDFGLSLTRGVDAAKAMHRSLVKLAPNAEFVTGRAADGRASERPHLALVPLPDVGHEYADGHLLGIAVVAPRESSEGDRSLVRELFAGWELDQEANASNPWLPLLLVGGLEWRVRRHDAPMPRGLLPSTWCRPARRWISATPVALDRNPGNLRSRDAGTRQRAFDQAHAIISEGCKRQGLPAPLIELSFAPMIAGSVPVSAFEPFPREPGRLRRVRVHAELLFEEPVRGPLILGAGRFLGLGLFRPIER